MSRSSRAGRSSVPGSSLSRTTAPSALRPEWCRATPSDGQKGKLPLSDSEWSTGAAQASYKIVIPTAHDETAALFSAVAPAHGILGDLAADFGGDVVPGD